jgi:arylsulfatase A-like enzyme
MSPRVSRREFLNATVAGAAAVTLDTRAVPAAARPNLLFILADDLGYGDLSCYGRPDYRTPALDGLAKQGVKFLSAYAAAPVCTPTRVAFATGRYPARLEVGLREPLKDPSREIDIGLPPNHPTVASRLKEAGYATALIGKWHMGWKPEFGPNRHGYDEFFGVLSGAADYFTHSEDLWENLTPVQRVGYLTDLLTDRAVQYIARPRREPFYLSLHYTAPHAPWEGPEDAAIGHEDHGDGPMTRGGSLKIYAAMMKSMDAGIGRVLRALARARLEKNTLVIFTSDNGGERYSFNWPFSFQKMHLWEGGLRVPAIVRWPGVIPAGRSTDQAAITMDWTATLMAAGGATADPAYPLDGEDLLPVCTGARAPYDRTLFWRTILRDAARIGQWKYLKESGNEHLFDVVADPGEKNDRRTVQPEVFDRVKTAFLAWNEKMLVKPAADPIGMSNLPAPDDHSVEGSQP